MELTNRELALLEDEMQKLVADKSRPSDVRHTASGVLGKVNGEVEYRKESNRNLNDPPLTRLP